jgi:hypothetical protein
VAETPDQPAEPSDEELRTMLEAREQVHATTQHQLARIGTRILAVTIVALLIGFFSFSDNREAVASMFREAAAEPEPAPPRQPQVAPANPGGGPESAADELIRATNQVNASPLALPADGKVVSKEDIGFVMQLLNFAQGPPNQEAPPAEKPKE